MVYPPLWLWLLATALTLTGFLLSRFPSFDRFLARFPAWACILLACLVLAALAGVWYLLGMQLGGLAFRLSFPSCLAHCRGR